MEIASQRILHKLPFRWYNNNRNSFNPVHRIHPPKHLHPRRPRSANNIQLLIQRHIPIWTSFWQGGVEIGRWGELVLGGMAKWPHLKGKIFNSFILFRRNFQIRNSWRQRNPRTQSHQSQVPRGVQGGSLWRY